MHLTQSTKKTQTLELFEAGEFYQAMLATAVVERCNWCNSNNNNTIIECQKEMWMDILFSKRIKWTKTSDKKQVNCELFVGRSFVRVSNALRLYIYACIAIKQCELWMQWDRLLLIWCTNKITCPKWYQTKRITNPTKKTAHILKLKIYHVLQTNTGAPNKENTVAKLQTKQSQTSQCSNKDPQYGLLLCVQNAIKPHSNYSTLYVNIKEGERERNGIVEGGWTKASFGIGKYMVCANKGGEKKM